MNDVALYTLNAMAHQLRVTVKWLRAEADAGRVPCLRAGDRLLFDLATVERVLMTRAVEIDAKQSVEAVPA